LQPVAAGAIMSRRGLGAESPDPHPLEAALTREADRDGDMNSSTLLKQPSAFLPVAMSLGALAAVLLHIALHGTAPQADEGTAAHIWQLLMAAQAPVVLFFAIKWVPPSPRQAVPILALQIGAAVAAMAPVFLLHW
jgi:hypothetical protein